MDEETYASPDVIAFVGQHFVPVKLNGESTREVRIWEGKFTEQQVALRLGTRGYPHTVFLTPDLKPIGSQGGYIGVETYLPLLKFVKRDLVGSMDFADFLAAEAGS